MSHILLVNSFECVYAYDAVWLQRLCNIKWRALNTMSSWILYQSSCQLINRPQSNLANI